MTAALLLIILALILGGVGLAVSALKFLLIIAFVFLLLGFFSGRSGGYWRY